VWYVCYDCRISSRRCLTLGDFTWLAAISQFLSQPVERVASVAGAITPRNRLSTNHACAARNQSTAVLTGDAPKDELQSQDTGCLADRAEYWVI
jgi:hypothetical protein